jgi:histidinol-phosphate aminotransferase
MTWFRPLLRPALDQLSAYHPAAAPADAVRLDANESPYPLPDDARAALAERIRALQTQRYPDVRATRLREAVAERYGAHPDELVLGCGSDEVIAMLLAALAHPRAGRAEATIVHPEPTFVMFRISALAQGLAPVAVPLDARWDLDVDAMREAIARHAPNVVFVPSPNNPTGNAMSDDGIAALVEATRERALLVLDEAYGAFAGRSYRDVRLANPHVGQLQTLSKVGLAAARVGWAVLPRELAREVDKVRQPYNLNSLSQLAGELCVREFGAAITAAVDAVVAERKRLAGALATLPGVRVEPSDANFLWVHVGNAGAVFQRLLTRGIVVRSFHAASPRLAGYLRITVGTPAQDDALLAALPAALEA